MLDATYRRTIYYPHNCFVHFHFLLLFGFGFISNFAGDSILEIFDVFIQLSCKDTIFLY